jgi:hypothetical protein
MDSFERLIGPPPSKQFLTKSRARLDALWKTRTSQQIARYKEQRSITDASFGVLRSLAGEDPKLAAATKRARALAAAYAKKKPTLPDKTPKIPLRVRLGSISATFVPPYWGTWQSHAQGGDAQGNAIASANGTLSLGGDTPENNNNSGWASEAAAVGGYFQPPDSNGILDIFANPGMSYDFQTWYVFDSANSGGFIGLYVGEYTLRGQFQAALVDQQINIASLGGSSGLPLAASIWVDSDHFYEIWVWAGINVSADGWHTFWGSAAMARMNVYVPAISIYYFNT